MITVVLLIVGFFAGAINSIAGGGALLAFPALLYAGLSPLSASITGFLVVWPGSLSAAVGNKKDLKKLPRKYFTLLIPCLIGGIIGMFALKATPSTTFDSVVPWLVLFTVTVFIFQPELQKHIKRPAHLRPQISLAIVWLGVLLVSIYAGYFGLGAGLILLTLFGFTSIKSIYQMIGLKNLAGFLITFSATIFFATSEHMIYKYGLPMAVGSIAGGYLGARFSHRISQHAVRILVSSIGIILVVVAFTKF